MARLNDPEIGSFLIDELEPVLIGEGRPPAEDHGEALAVFVRAYTHLAREHGNRQPIIKLRDHLLSLLSHRAALSSAADERKAATRHRIDSYFSQYAGV